MRIITTMAWDELNNNEDMRSFTVFLKTTIKVYLIWTSKEENMSRLKHLSTQKSKKGKYESQFLKTLLLMVERKIRENQRKEKTKIRGDFVLG